MSDETRESSTLATFWGQMDRNSERARQMPDWVKGSTVNHRAASVSAGAEPLVQGLNRNTSQKPPQPQDNPEHADD